MATTPASAAALAPKKQQHPKAARAPRLPPVVSASTSPHEVRVSSTHPVAFYVDIALRLFLAHESIRIEGVGAAIQSAIEVAQAIGAKGFGRPTRVETFSAHATNGTPKPGFRMEVQRIKMPHGPSAHDAKLTSDERKLLDAADRDEPTPDPRSSREEATSGGEDE